MRRKSWRSACRQCDLHKPASNSAVAPRRQNLTWRIGASIHARAENTASARSVRGGQGEGRGRGNPTNAVDKPPASRTLARWLVRRFCVTSTKRNSRCMPARRPAITSSRYDPDQLLALRPHRLALNHFLDVTCVGERDNDRRKDRHGRTLATITVDGKDVGDPDRRWPGAAMGRQAPALVRIVAAAVDRPRSRKIVLAVHRNNLRAAAVQARMEDPQVSSVGIRDVVPRPDDQSARTDRWCAGRLAPVLAGQRSYFERTSHRRHSGGNWLRLDVYVG